MFQYAREAADFATKGQLPHLDFAVNHYGKPDVAMFDFTSMYAADHSARVVERHGHRLLQVRSVLYCKVAVYLYCKPHRAVPGGRLPAGAVLAHGYRLPARLLLRAGRDVAHAAAGERQTLRLGTRCTLTLQITVHFKISFKTSLAG